jgi:simple sugar transport system permease protein
VLVLQGIAFVLILASEVLRDVDWPSLRTRLLKFGAVPSVPPTPQIP